MFHLVHLLAPEPCCYISFFSSEPPTTLRLLFLPFLPAPTQEAARDAECEDAAKTKCWYFLNIWCGGKPLTHHLKGFITVSSVLLIWDEQKKPAALGVMTEDIMQLT